MTLRNILVALAVAALAGFVLADALPDQSTLTFTSGGELIGSGTYTGGDLTVDFPGAVTAGEATLTVTTRGGGTLTYTVDLQVDADGNVTSITLVDSNVPLEQINPSIFARGGTATYCTTIDSVNTCASPSPSAPGPNYHANQHAFDHAGSGIDNAPGQANGGSGSDHANEHAHAGAGNSGH